MRFLVLLLFLWSNTAAAIDCAQRPDRKSGEPWRYRTIDGKACWYRSIEGGVPKSALQWERRVEAGEQLLESPVIVRTISYPKPDEVLVEPTSRIIGKFVAAFCITLTVAIFAAVATSILMRHKTKKC